METLASTFIYRHTRIRIVTEHPTEFVDLTAGLESLVLQTGMVTGLANVLSCHTTAAIVVNEHEPRLLGDFAVEPVNLTADERGNGRAHCGAIFLGSSACLDVVNGRLLLERWQRVLLAEQDGPRPREISVLLLGQGRR